MRAIDCFIDPVCPWCWITSDWIRTVRHRAGLDVRWRYLSLALLDGTSGSPPPPYIAAIHARGQSHLAVLAAVRRLVGDEAEDLVLEATGMAIWHDVPAGDRATLRAWPARTLDLAGILSSVGVDPAIAGEVAEEDHATVRTETELAVERVGTGLGTPVVTFDPPTGRSFFGPVIAETPTDPDAAVALWRALEALATHDGFAELRTNLRPTPDVPLLRALVSGGARSGTPSGSRPSGSRPERARRSGD